MEKASFIAWGVPFGVGGNLFFIVSPRFMIEVFL